MARRTRPDDRGAFQVDPEARGMRASEAWERLERE
jgi:hypothetical protein